MDRLLVTAIWLDASPAPFTFSDSSKIYCRDVGGFLLPLRRDSLERVTLLCAVVAAASSALFGLGYRWTTLDVVRLLFHFFAYALGVVLCVRWLARLRRTSGWFKDSIHTLGRSV